MIPPCRRRDQRREGFESGWLFWVKARQLKSPKKHDDDGNFDIIMTNKLNCHSHNSHNTSDIIVMMMMMMMMTIMISSNSKYQLSVDNSLNIYPHTLTGKTTFSGHGHHRAAGAMAVAASGSGAQPLKPLEVPANSKW